MEDWTNDIYPAGTGLLDPEPTAQWENQYYPVYTPTVDFNSDRGEQSNTFGANDISQNIDYTAIIDGLGAQWVNELVSSVGTGSLAPMINGMADSGISADPEPNNPSWIGKLFGEVSGDTWAKILGGAAAGLGQAYVANKALEIQKQSADTNRQSADLAKSKDKRAAESAKNLQWRMGLIGARK